MAIRVTDLRVGQGDYAALDDRMLVLDFQAGHPEAFVEIHKRYAPLARHVCARFLPNKMDADEALQETMIRVFQGLHRFNGQFALQPWVARIATNVSLDAIRTRTRRPKVDEESVEEHDREDPSDGPDAVIERLIERDLVLSVLTGLPDHHRTALVLRELEGRSHKEIAELMDITPAQAKALIHRAKASFRRDWLVAITEKGGLAGFAVLPLMWFLKTADVFKRFADRAGHAAQAAQVATPELVTTASQTAGPSAVSVGERLVAAGMTILVAGGVTVGAVSIADRERDHGVRAEPPSTSTIQPAAPTTSESIPEVREQPAPRSDRGRDRRGQDERVAEPPLVQPEPTVSPTPPTEEPSPSPTTDPSPPPETVIPPAPAWEGAFSVAWPSADSCGCGSGVSLVASSANGDLLSPGGALQLEQRLTGAASDAEGDAAWALSALLQGRLTRADGTIDLSFDLTSDAGKTHFLGRTQVTSVSGDLDAGDPRMVFSLSGAYEATGDVSASPIATTGSVSLQIAIWQDGSTAYLTGIDVLP